MHSIALLHLQMLNVSHRYHNLQYVYFSYRSVRRLMRKYPTAVGYFHPTATGKQETEFPLSSNSQRNKLQCVTDSSSSGLLCSIAYSPFPFVPIRFQKPYRKLLDSHVYLNRLITFQDNYAGCFSARYRSTVVSSCCS